MQSLPFSFAKEQVPLAPLTLYHIGGPARLALVPETADELAAAYRWMAGREERRLVLGGGSNMLISDAGFPGTVLLTTGMKRFEDLGGHRYYVGAGHDLSWLVREIMLPNNYEGVGGLTGIPGSVGGAIYMNAGTVNGWTCQYMESVDLMGPDGPVTIPMRDDLYSYRGQFFCPPGEVIVGGVFQFAVSERDQRALHEHYLKRRREKQPPGRSCGSVFKNPEGDHAGRLIESCGLKGTRRGGAVISEMHANFIINENDASFADVMALIALVKETVLARHGVLLEEEVRIIQ